MPAPVVPWEPCNIPEEIQDELNRRKINRSFRYVENTQGNWDSKTGDWSKYRGPMTPWVRLCSNSNGLENPYSGDFEKPVCMIAIGRKCSISKIWMNLMPCSLNAWVVFPACRNARRVYWL